jgi:hypothetical protein
MTVATRCHDRYSERLESLRACRTRGCPWRGPHCPLHPPARVDLALARLMAERPFVAPLAAGVAA